MRHDVSPRSVRRERQAARAVGWPLLVALTGVLVYVNSVTHGFALDDIALVRDNLAIHSVEGLPRLFLQPYWTDGAAAGLYRPVTVASFALNRALLGAEPFGFHLVNVLLHGMVCALAWFALRRAGTLYGTAFLGAMIFAVHPLHTEAVANVAGRAELLAALGVLAAWLAHRGAAEATERARRWRLAVLAAVCYLLALLAKEGAVLAPLLFVLDDTLRRRERRGPEGSRGIVAYGLYAVALAVALALRFVALGGFRGAEDVAFIDNPAAVAGTGVRVATALWVLSRYAWLLIWPARLSSDYSYDAIPPVETLADPRWLIGLLVVSGVLGLGLYGWRRSRPICLGVAVICVFLLPASNLPFAVGTLMSERLIYLPSLGACLLIGHFAARLYERFGGAGPARAFLLVLLTALLISLAGRTLARNPVWADNLTLATHDSGVTPRSAKLHAGAGIALHAEGNLEPAERHYRRALEIYPEYAQVHYNLGELLTGRGAEAEAIEHFRRAASISPSNPRPFKSLARLLHRRERVEESLEAFAAAVRLDPVDHRFRFAYGRALFRAGRHPEAMAQFASLAEDDAEGGWGRLSAALVLSSEGRAGEAMEILEDLLGDQGLGPAMRGEAERLHRALTAPRAGREDP